MDSTLLQSEFTKPELELQFEADMFQSQSPLQAGYGDKMLPPLDMSYSYPQPYDMWQGRSDSSDSSLSTPDQLKSNYLPSLMYNVRPYDMYSMLDMNMRMPQYPYNDSLMPYRMYPMGMGSFSSKPLPQITKRYRCSMCGKGFSRPSSLTTHTYSHTGEKPFRCPVDGCGRQFSVVSNLRRHGKVHQSNS